MPPLFQQTPTGYVVATGRVANTYDEALRRAQELQKQLGVQLYVSPLSTGGYRLQTGRIGSQSEANKLAQQWAQYGVKYISPLYTPQTPAQRYEQPLQRTINELFTRATQPAPQAPQQPPPLPTSPQLEALRQQIGQIVGQLQSQLNRPFQYDPSSDPVFQTASRAAQRQVMEAMNERGILNSTITAERASQVVGELAAEFAWQAFERQQAQTQALLNLLSPLITQAQFEATLPLQVAELTGYYGTLPTLAARAQQLEREQMQMQALSNIINSLINQAQFERSFPLAESEVTGVYNGRPTQQAQERLIALISDLARSWGVPPNLGNVVPGPFGQVLNIYGRTLPTIHPALQELLRLLRLIP